MHYAGARFYMSALGRWGTTDPLADDFPAWSPYNYVQNNPVSLVDPDGRAPMDDYRIHQDGSATVQPTNRANTYTLVDQAGNERRLDLSTQSGRTQLSNAVARNSDLRHHIWGSVTENEQRGLSTAEGMGQLLVQGGGTQSLAAFLQVPGETASTVGQGTAAAGYSLAAKSGGLGTKLAIPMVLLGNTLSTGGTIMQHAADAVRGDFNRFNFATDIGFFGLGKTLDRGIRRVTDTEQQETILQSLHSIWRSAVGGAAKEANSRMNSDEEPR
ncbi:hypothetical protein CRI93_00895 [Longimonas halophila]|uniref:RHS repeat-associated core domain-containing protein n=1 Tax=Longimonas halophila TaxID=1469170 RepID=A0A2H3PAM0_9BACT|nr:RHS repeat-associated core domain-containing protein [Longimonas halophila]PEN09318.1 hypothetical protein CRI93_00895 [Longimonas halophila]